MPQRLPPPPHSHDTAGALQLVDALRRGEWTAALDALDPDALVRTLEDLDALADALRVLLKAARARRRSRPRRNGKGDHHAA